MMKNFFTMRFQRQLALLAMAFAFPSGGATVVLPWLLVLWGFQLAGKHKVWWIRSPVDYPIAVFLLLTLVAGVLSAIRLVALPFWLLVVLGFVIAFQMTLRHLQETPGFARSLYRAFAMGSLVAAVYGFAVLYLAHAPRVQLLTLGAQALGFGLMAGIFLTLPLFRSTYPWPQIAVLTTGVAMAAIIATFNRAALYGLVVGGITYVWLERQRLSSRLAGALVLSLLVGFLAVLTLPPVKRSLAGYLRIQGVDLAGPTTTPVLLKETIRFVFSGEAHSDRMLAWESALGVIRAHPWFGVGLGAFPFVVHQLVPQAPPGTLPHNIYLSVAAEAGIPAAVAFTAIPLAAILAGLRQQGPRRSGTIAATTGILAAEFRDHILGGFHMFLGFNIVLAMLVGPSEAEDHATPIPSRPE